MMSVVAELEVFHEIGPDEQNARGLMEAVSDLGTKSLLSQTNGGVVDQIKWTGEHTLSSDILVPDHVNTCTPAKQVYT